MLEFVVDEKGRKIYNVMEFNSPTGKPIRTIMINNDVAFVAKDCLDALDYVYDKTHPNRPIYNFVSPENIINNNKINDPAKSTGALNQEVYIKSGYRNQVNKVLLITRIGFIEHVSKSNMPQAQVFQHWMNNEVYAKLYNGEPYAIDHGKNGGFTEFLRTVDDKIGVPDLRGDNAARIKDLITNYARICRITYPMAFQKFKLIFWNVYKINLEHVLPNKYPYYREIVDHGYYEQAKLILNTMIYEASSANAGPSEIMRSINSLMSELEMEWQNMQNKMEENNIIPRPLPCGFHRFTTEQKQYINNSAKANNITPFEAMKMLY